MKDFWFDLPDRLGEDFSAQIEAGKALWAAFENGTHDRPPIRYNINPRMLMLDPAYNKRGITYQEYFTDPEVMARVQLEWYYWRNFILPGDHERGLPEKWVLWIDFQNTYDATWFGAPLHYRDNQVPDTTPLLDDDRKRMLFDKGIPEPFAGEWPERWLKFHEHFKKKSEAGWTFLGRPVELQQNALYANTDGVFTTAACLRGATEICMDLLADPDYAHELLDYIMEATIARMKAWRKFLGIPVPCDNYIAADDSIEMLSCDQYIEHIFPIHQKIYEIFGTQKNRGLHLCGDAQRHFKTFREKLNVTTFDTGFPIDFGKLREELGPGATICGGPHVRFFIEDSPGPIIAETERILRSGVLRGGRFILQEGNNLPPRARLENCQACYDTGVRVGREVMAALR